jgi:hypothetical protein
MAFGDAVSAAADSHEAAWIAPRLGRFGTVGGIVPNGYEAHLLVDYRRPGDPAGWEGVQLVFAELATLLAQETTTPEACAFAFWEGYGFVTSRTLVAQQGDGVDPDEVARLRHEAQRADVDRSGEVTAALSLLPIFELPNRRYYLVVGAVEAASRIMRPDGLFPQPPDLWWPKDRRWFVGGDTDLDWCYVAGPLRLIGTIQGVIDWPTRMVAWEQTNADAGRMD